MSNRAFISQFSPQGTDPETLEKILVQRHELLTESVAKLRESVLTRNKHHLLFIGPRGAGKTHLIALIHHRLSQQTDLGDRMRIAWLNEDETSTSFLKLLVRIYRELNKRYPSQFPDSDLQTIFGRDPEEARELLGTVLLSHLGERNIVVLIENLDSLFAAMPEIEQRTWRAFVQNHPVFATAASAQSLFAGVANRDLPFFGFFDTDHLRPLSVEDATALLEKIAEFNTQSALREFLRTPRGKARIRAIHHLSGGNPRLYIIFSEFLTRESLDDLVRPFQDTVDKQLTAYYQERLRWLSPQQQEIVQFLDVGRARPVSVRDIAEGIFATHNTLTAQLKQLREKGYVSFSPRGREVLYELAEPLMRLSFQVKETHDRKPLTLIVDFLRVWYDRDEIEQRLSRFEPQASGREYFEAALEKLTVDGPSFRHAILREGLDQIDLNHCDRETVDHLECVAIETNSPEDWSNLGLARYHRGEYQSAIKVWSRVLTLMNATQEQIAKALICRAQSYQKSGKLDEEIADYTRAIDLPGAPAEHIARALVIRGVTHGYAGRVAEATTDFIRTIELPGAPAYLVASALVNRGYAHGRAGRVAEAIADYTLAIELPGVPAYLVASALVIRGVAHGQAGRVAEAIADFTRAIDLPGAPACLVASALVNRGVTHGPAGRVAEATADFTRTIELPGAPADQVASALYNRGYANGQAGRVAEEIADYTRAIDLPGAPADLVAKALVNRGNAYLRLNRAREALDDLAGFLRYADHGAVADLVRGSPDYPLEIFVRSAFCLSHSANPWWRDLRKLIDFFDSLKVLTHLGQTLVSHLETLAASHLNAAGLENWAAGWEALGKGHPEMEIPLRMLRAGIAWIHTREESSLLALAKEERQVVRSALKLPPETK